MFHDVIPTPAYVRKYGKRALLKELSDEELISELYKRGVDIPTVFGRYYELDEGTSLTIGDAQLASPGAPINTNDVPF